MHISPAYWREVGRDMHNTLENPLIVENFIICICLKRVYVFYIRYMLHIVFKGRSQ